MRIIAVQTGLEPDSVLGGCITDREFLTRLADRRVEVHLLVENDRPVIDHQNIFVHYWKRYSPKKLYYISNIDIAIGLRQLSRELGHVDWVRFNHPVVNGIGTALASNGHRIWASYLHCEDYVFWRMVDRYLPARCDMITCLSEDTRRDVVARCPQSDHERNVVLPVGIDFDRIDRVARSRADIRAELGVSDSDVLILYVGVLIPRKGIKDLVATWRLLPRDPSIRLLLIAQPVTPVESALVEELTRIDPRVKHLKRVPYEHIADYFRASDIFFFPTHREGFGIVVGEAMATSLPVVTTRARGVRTVVCEDETALLADVGDCGRLAAHLERLIRDRDLREGLGIAGRERVHRHFRWEVIIEKLVKLLQGNESNHSSIDARRLWVPRARASTPAASMRS
jgi:glycosyltransferase involved in cell wall biosynthesis